MSLELPQNFKNDIQGKDTALVPIIIIGDYGTNPNDWIYISTNQITLPLEDVIGGGATIPQVNYKPLLLNIPSLKESIDIEKRNYKISSINIDISNFPHEGQRFSELVGDSSLINKECRILWVSPSTTNVIFRNLMGSNMWTDGDAFQIFNGTIRRYTHDDEKVRLVVEDRSQSTLHKPLPIANLGTDDEVPDKYKNKPIPMVYGHVDKSPLVISSSGVENQDGEYIFIPDTQIEENNFEIIKHPYDVLGGTEESYLYIYQDDKYSSVLQEVTGGGILSDVGTRYSYISNEQYDLSANKKYITVYNKYTSSTTGEYYEGTNPIAYNEAFVYYISYVQNSILFTPLNNISFDGNWNGTELSVHVIYPDAHLGGYTAGFTTIKWDGSVQPRESSELKLVWKFNAPPPSSVGEYYGYTKISGIFEYLSYLFSEGSEDNTSILVVYRDMASYPHPDPDNPYVYPGESKQLFRKDAPPSSDNDIINIEDTSTERWKTTPINTASITATIHPGVTGEGIYDWDGHYAYCLAKMPFNMSDNYTVHFFMIDGFLESDFYANVKGRAMRTLLGVNLSPSAPSAIADILNTELGQDITVSDAVPVYDSWQYAFTIDKKINSKKLIEGIASASPYIPRFDNMGNFKFDVIPMSGGIAEHTIKEADVIDFSFSRTKIEQVYTKIEFKYNWDYARGKFNDSVEVEVGEEEGIIANYSFDYYGFENDHSESTLIIDDDRGKYIRHTGTAQKFADWYLMWSCNQHLKMKIKLPLKYMHLEIGDLVDFDAILGGVKPYGIDYKAEWEEVNHLRVFNNFLITSTNKTLEWVEVECIQMHELSVCNPDCNNNCEGEGEYGAVVDECGVCGGDNSSCADCAGVPNGNSFLDCEEVCGVPTDLGWTVDCGDGDCVEPPCLTDCFGVISGDAVVDACGVCGGDNSPSTGTCDCASTPNGTAVEDCAGVCGGDAVEDECGVCNGDGIPDGECDCNGNVDDCAGVCGGDAVEDDCEVCNGDGANVECWNGDVVCNEILCDEPEGYVLLWGEYYEIATTTEINREGEGLTGEIPPRIGNLTYLTSLDLGMNPQNQTNQLTGEIPPEIGNLTNLTYLNLGHNRLPDGSGGFSGEIPSEIGNLTNLTALHLSHNNLTGNIPSEIEHLTNLITLNLAHNDLTGIPIEIGNLTNLEYLYLSSNDLTGSIPSEIWGMTNLKYLQLHWNYLSGEIPIEIGQLTSLASLDLRTNQLSGEIPVEICNQGDSTPKLSNNKLCPPYPGCGDGEITSEDEQDTLACPQLCELIGDINEDGAHNVLDVVALTLIILDEECQPEGTSSAIRCDCADTNRDGGWNVLDIVALMGCVLGGECDF